MTKHSRIQIAMVALLLVVLAAMTIPNFVDFRSEAKDATTRAGLSVLRAGIAVGVAAIQLKEDPSANTPRYPTLEEMRRNEFGEAHPRLVGTNLLDPSRGIPPNPWSDGPGEPNALLDCQGLRKGTVLNRPGETGFGWCYDASTGNIWANSANNGAGEAATENLF